MKLVISLCVGACLCVCAESVRAAEETNGDAAKLQKSRDTWDELKKKCHGNYRYFVRTSSFSGVRTETEVVVQKNKVAGRRYKVTGGSAAVLRIAPAVPGDRPAKPASPKYKWTERGTDIGGHKQGAPAKTLDELYADAAKAVAHALKPSEKRYLRFDARGLLKSCFYVDTRIADDAPTTGVIIAEIRLKGTGDKK